MNKRKRDRQAAGIADMAAFLGALGGKATAKKRTAEQRSEAARKAAIARWEKRPEPPRFHFRRVRAPKPQPAACPQCGLTEKALEQVRCNITTCPQARGK